MANTYNRNQKKGGSGFVTALLAILMAAILVFVGGVLGFFAHKDAWFGKDETAQTEGEDKPLGAGGMTMPEKVEEDNIALMSAAIPRSNYALMSVPGEADSAVTVKATLYDYQHEELDETALSHVQLNWTLKWAHESGFAVDKDVNEYVTVSPADDTLSATVSCLQPFAQQIVLTVGAEGHSTVTASINVDYLQRYDHFQATVHMVSKLMPTVGGSAYADRATANFDSKANYYVRWVTVDFPAYDWLEVPVEWTNTNNSIEFTVVGTPVYTIPLTYTVGGLNVRCAFSNEVAAAGGSPIREYNSPIDVQYDELTHTFKNIKFHDLLGMNFTNVGTFSVSRYRSAMAKAQPLSTSAVVYYKFLDVKVNGEAVEDDNGSSTGPFSFGIGFTAGSLYVSPEEMALDQSDIVF